MDKASLDEIIGCFKKRIEICFFDPLYNLLLPKYQTTGFIILSIISSLIDLLCQYYYHGESLKQKDKYKKFLREHFKEFTHPLTLKKMPHVNDYADFFYEGFRCHILHNFMLSEHSTIGWKTDLVILHNWNENEGSEELVVNPRLLIDRLDKTFQNYMKDLLDKKNVSLRDAFAKKLFIDTGVKVKVK